jgi:hypothetical protein
LAAALLAILVTGTIGTAMAELARLELVLATQRKQAAAALAAVDACAEAAVAGLPPGWDFTGVLQGDDGIVGTADDGLLPLAADCSGTARAAPGAAMPPRLVLELEATRRGGRRRMEAIVRRRADPGVPALVWLTDAAAAGRIAGRLALDGADPVRPLPPRSMLAAPGEPAGLDLWVAAQGAALSASGGTEAPIWAPEPPLAALRDRAASAGAVVPAVGLTATPPAAPRLILATGDLAITTPQYGAGILFVDGQLRLEAPLTFAGVVAATGGLRVEATGRLDLAGALWIGAEGVEGLAVDGDATIVASAAAVEAADALLALPRRARLASVRDF